jgi:hypothetical protein
MVLASSWMGSSGAQAITVFGLPASGTSLVRFDSATPGNTSTIAVTGLTAGDALVGIDFRPATGALFGVGVNGNSARVYMIDPGTGVATAVGPAATVNSITGATAWGMDFNPTVDRIRLINNLVSDGAGGNANNFRMNPNTGALVTIDPDLDFSGLPGGAINAPDVAVAYTNNFNNIGGATTLHGVVSGGDRLIIHGGAGPGFPTLMNVGSLGVNTTNNSALDIIEPGNQAFSILEVGGSSQFFTVDLASGAVSLVGPIGDGSEDFQSMAVTLQAAIPSPLLSPFGLLLLAAALAISAIMLLRRRIGVPS